jgi:signal transduction histidine kinase
VTANVQMAERHLRALVRGKRTEQGDSPSRPEPSAERAALLLERTDRQILRLDRLVGDLLDASRIQAGKLELRREPCDLLAAVGEAVEMQRAAWSGRSIALDLPRGDAITLEADPDRIGQVVNTLLTNALKYSPPEQPVAVRVRRVGETARVEVIDHGPGLSAEQQAHLFERFFRVPGIEQQSGSGVGLGLGLYICKTIIERHGGVVGVESALGKGSTFWFMLPLDRADPAPGTEQHPA